MEKIYKILILFLVAFAYTQCKWTKPEKGKPCKNDKDCPPTHCCAREPKANYTQRIDSFFCYDKQKKNAFCPLGHNQFKTDRLACPCLDNLKCVPNPDKKSIWGQETKETWGRCEGN